MATARLVTAQIPSPNFQWATAPGGPDSDTTLGMATDADGSVYITGYFVPSATFGAISLTSTNPEVNFYVAKYSRSGSVVWAKQAVNSLGGGSLGYGIAVHADQTVYVCGGIGPSPFGPVTFGSLSANGESGGFFTASYDSTGTCRWLRQLGARLSSGSDLALDSYGNVYVVGYIYVQPTFRDVMLAKYDPTGELLWSRTYTVNNNNQAPLYRIAVDASGTSYVAGYFRIPIATMGNFTVTNRGGSDLLLLRHTPDGVLKWAKSAGGTGADMCSGVAVDRAGNGYVTGTVEGTAAFDDINVTNTSGSQHLFVASFDSSGDFNWATAAGGSGFSQGFGAATDLHGGVYIAAFFNGTFQFGNLTATTTPFRSLVARFASSGELTWTRTLAASSNILARAIACDVDSDVLVAGTFTGTAIIGSSAFTSRGPSDIYVACLHAWPPVLSSMVADNMLRLSWGTNPPGLVLEKVNDVSSPQWTTSGPPSLDGHRYTLTVPATESVAVYRLRQ